MKPLIIFSLAGLFTLSVPAVQAQTDATKDYPAHQKNSESENLRKQNKEPLTPEQKAQKQTDHLQKKLGLSEEQKQKVYDLNLKRINETRALREKNQSSGNRQGSKEEIQKIRSDFDSGLNAILNADQQKQWTQMKADAKARQAQRQQNRGKNGKGGKTQAQPADDTEELEGE